MKMIDWSMGEFYMIGSYVQYALLASVLGWERWYLALPLSVASVFVLGVIVQRFLLRPMYLGGIERCDEYATIITIALMVLFRKLAIVLGGPNQYSPKDYAKPTMLLTLPISGNRMVALVLLALFYVLTRRTWLGRAFRDAAQNRVGIQPPAWTCCASTCSPSGWVSRSPRRRGRSSCRTSSCTRRTERSRPSRASRSS